VEEKTREDARATDYFSRMPAFWAQIATLVYVISSVEEFILLLKKWRAEAARVRLLASFADAQLSSCRGVLRLSGVVTEIDEPTQVFRLGDSDQFAMIGFAGCRLGYGTGDDVQLSSQMSEAEELDDLVCFVTPAGISVCIYTVK